MAKCTGVIIKQSNFGEGHRMLWIFTDKFGIVKAVAHGAEKLKSKSGAATQFLAMCDFDFYENGDVWNINSVVAKDTFWHIQEDIVKLALCTYFADLVYYSLELRNPDINVFRLFLNTLYACAYREISHETIKLVFELKLMFITGFMPLPDSCSVCGQTEARYFDVRTGGILCEDCRGTAVKLDDDMYKSVYYIIHCDVKKMFSVMYPEKAVVKLSELSEKYITGILGKNISSLEYYKKFI